MSPAKKTHVSYSSLVYSLIPKRIHVSKAIYLVLVMALKKIKTRPFDGKSEGKGVILKYPCERQNSFSLRMSTKSLNQGRTSYLRIKN